jgi:hypothetical protein
MTDVAEQKPAEHKVAEQKKQDKRPDIQIIVNQSFIFMEGDGSNNKRVVAPSQTYAQVVPAWVADTDTYKNGIADKTIVLLGTVSTKEESAEEENSKNKPADDKSKQVDDKGHKAGLQK